MKTLDSINQELNRLFDLFNGHYYAGELVKPIVAVQSNGRKSRAMGWCTLQKIWKDQEQEQYYYEITICSEFLFREVSEICATLLHEMAHLYNVEQDIKDVSRGGTYHNKKFKATAESHGLIISHDDKIGWSVSRLNPAAERFAKDNAKSELFTLTRSGVTASGGVKKKGSMRKYVCPGCGLIIRATKEVKVKCAECDELLEEEQK